MKKIACDTEGKICEFEMTESGGLTGEVARRDITEECIYAVYAHLHYNMIKNKSGGYGYTFPKNQGEGNWRVVIYDDNVFELKEREDKE